MRLEAGGSVETAALSPVVGSDPELAAIVKQEREEKQPKEVGGGGMATSSQSGDSLASNKSSRSLGRGMGVGSKSASGANTTR